LYKKPLFQYFVKTKKEDCEIEIFQQIASLMQPTQKPRD
jgi:hypothetical protein